MRSNLKAFVSLCACMVGAVSISGCVTRVFIDLPLRSGSIEIPSRIRGFNEKVDRSRYAVGFQEAWMVKIRAYAEDIHYETPLLAYVGRGVDESYWAGWYAATAEVESLVETLIETNGEAGAQQLLKSIVEEKKPSQALQTTSVTRSGFGKVSVSDRQRRGV